MPDLIDLEIPPQLYGGRDPHIPEQKIPEGEVDVVAIARSSLPSPGNDRWLMAPKQPNFESTEINSHDNELNNYSRRVTSEIIPGEGWTSKPQ